MAGSHIQAGTDGTSVASPHCSVAPIASSRNDARPIPSRPDRIVPTSTPSRNTGVPMTYGEAYQRLFPTVERELG